MLVVTRWIFYPGFPLLFASLNMAPLIESDYTENAHTDWHAVRSAMGTISMSQKLGEMQSP